MTSKEAVCHIKKALYGENYVLDLLKEDFQQIEKDSEVLNLLKRYIKKNLKWFMCFCDDDTWHWFIDKKQDIKITKEEFEKVKEWLSNDK